MSTEHNPAPPPPFRCSLQTTLGQNQLLAWNQEFSSRTMLAVKRTNATLEKDIPKQRGTPAFLISSLTLIEDPVPLNFVQPLMSDLLDNASSSSTATGLAPPPELLVQDPTLGLMRHTVDQIIDDDLPYTMNMPVPTPSVHIGDVGYIHKKTGEFVRLVNPFNMKHTAVGAMQCARGLEQDILRVCRHPEQAWSSGLSSSSDAPKIQLSACTSTCIVANGIISTHAHVKSVLEMRTWLAWHTPLIMAVYGPAHGITRSDLLMVTSTVTARRWLMFAHSGVPTPAEAIVSVSGEGDDCRLNVELPAGVRSITVHSPSPPPTGDAPEYALSVFGLTLRSGAILPETLDMGGRSINMAVIEAATATFRAEEEAKFIEDEKQLDDLLRDIDEYAAQLPSTDELKRQIGMVRVKLQAARQDPFSRHEIMSEIREIGSGWECYMEDLREASSRSSHKSRSKLFMGPWTRWLRRKTRIAGLPRGNLN